MRRFIRGERGWQGFRRAQAAENEKPGDPPPSTRWRASSSRGARATRPKAVPPTRGRPEDARRIREQSTAYLASIDLDAGRVDDATRLLDDLAATAKDPQLRERAELRRADVEIARGRKDLAAVPPQGIPEGAPDSPLAVEAQALLDALQGKPPAAPVAPAAKENH